MLRALLVLLVVGCARYTYVPDDQTPECRDYKLPRSTWSVVSAALVETGPLTGRVTDASNDHPIAGASVTLAAPTPVTVKTDSAGRFALTAPPGRYRLTVRGIGYEVADDSVALPLPARHELAVRFVPAVLDGPCSGFGVVKTRKPWWKLW